MKAIQILRIAFLFAIAGLCSCASTSRSYVDDLAGYSVTEGRITRIENLEAHLIEPLADGVAMTLTQPCRVWMEFDNGESRSFEIGSGVILVHGYDSDFILESTLQPASPPNDR